MTPTATPIFSPGAGTYSTPQVVTISSPAPGALIRYTTDGSAPTGTRGTPYSGPISVAESETIRAIALESGWMDSAVAEAAYAIGVAAPAFTPSGATYDTALTVALSTTTSGATIRYTTDGVTAPSETVGVIYAGPISVSTNQTIQAVACMPGSPTSAVSTASYSVLYWTTLGTSGGGASQFRNPYGVAVDSIGNIYVGDEENNRIVRISDMTGAGWTAFGSPGTGTGQFDFPTALALAGGQIYVADQANGRVVRIDDFAGTGWTALGGFSGPSGIAFDRDGRMYIADAYNSRIVRVSDMTGSGWVAFGTVGHGTNQFMLSSSIALDGNGRIYVADTQNHRIVRMDDMSGTGWTTYGTEGSGVNQFSFPFGVTLDSSGRIYIADTDNFRVVRVDDMSGAGWKTFNTQKGGSNQFSGPLGVAIDASGRCIVSDGQDGRIVRFVMP